MAWYFVTHRNNFNFTSSQYGQLRRELCYLERRMNNYMICKSVIVAADLLSYITFRRHLDSHY
jgi:hypothetical protein